MPAPSGRPDQPDGGARIASAASEGVSTPADESRGASRSRADLRFARRRVRLGAGMPAEVARALVARELAFARARLARGATALRARAGLALRRRRASCTLRARLRARRCARLAALTALRATFSRALAFFNSFFAARTRVRAAATDLLATRRTPDAGILIVDSQRGDPVVHQRELELGDDGAAGEIAGQFRGERRIAI